MTARKVLVLGATGGTGRQVVAQAVRLGHTVTALVRDPTRLSTRDIAPERLRVVTGSLNDDGSALAAAMQGQDVVISALGVGKSFRSGGLISRSMGRIIHEMEAQGVRRILVTSAFGVGETYRDVPPLPRLFIRLLLGDIYRDKLAGEELLRRSTLDWTVVCPTGLVDGPATAQHRVGERLALRGMPRIARADVAAFLLAQMDDRTFERKQVLISA
jgi:putative NADH-flavin reductase